MSVSLNYNPLGGVFHLPLQWGGLLVSVAVPALCPYSLRVPWVLSWEPRVNLEDKRDLTENCPVCAGKGLDEMAF